MSSAAPHEPDDRARASGVIVPVRGVSPQAPRDATPRMPGNSLGREASPYLRRHAGQKIRWQAWNQQSFALAERSGRPILVSIGYLACYWCHVMAEESFSDPRVIRVINRDFVAIKVDREERPDVDRAVLDAMARLGARTGWPVTAFMTPQGDVFAGGSYFPPEPRHGLPGLLDVMADAAQRFGDRNGAEDTKPVPFRAGTVTPHSAATDIESYAVFLANRLLDNIDTLYGGFGETGPRFPQVSAHQLLWHHFVLTGNKAFGDAVVESLSRICGSALYDAVGGGFHRYCVDDAWTTPHFEKMLYDNAQLIELLSWVWRGSRARPLRDAIEGSVGWLLREMLLSEAGFASSLGAHNDQGIDEAESAGLFYRWERGELEHSLGADAGFFFTLYDLCPHGDHPAGPLQRTERPIADADRSRLTACLQRLFERREARRRPERDDKVLADWNGLAVVALIEAGSALDRRDWLAAARHVFDALTARLNQGDALFHCSAKGIAGPAGFLEDHAAMSRAALRLYEAFGQTRYRDLAIAWVEALDADFWDEEAGGYFMSAASQWNGVARVKSITETSLPSGNALMIGVLARLHEVTGEGRYRERAERLVEVFRADIVRHGIAAATAVDNVLTLGRFVRIAVSGRPDRAETRDLMRAALDCSLPDRMVLGPGSGAHAPVDGQATAQVCIGTCCLLPIVSADALRRLTAPGGLSRADDPSRYGNAAIRRPTQQGAS